MARLPTTKVSADLFRKALHGALRERDDTLTRVKQRLGGSGQMECCPRCGAGFAADDALLDADVRAEFPDAGEAHLRIFVQLECATCDAEFELTTLLLLEVESVECVAVPDIDPLGAGDSGGHSSRDVHARFDGTGNWSR